MHPATLNEPDGGFQPLLEEEVEEERVSETHIVEQPAEGSGSPCLGIKEALVKFVDGVKVSVLSCYQKLIQIKGV